MREFSDLRAQVVGLLEATAESGAGNYAVGGAVRYQRFRPGAAKLLFDEIDRLLSEHYGFSDEELDFIINYDIKYRMGGAESDEEQASGD